MSTIKHVTRRDFLKLTGIASSGFILQSAIGVSQTAFARSLSTPSSQLNVFVAIDLNDTVKIVAHRSEMGQGIRTSLPQVVADEMDADWDKVLITQATGDSQYGSQNTDGSRSVREFYQTMREIGATAKLLLRQAAAAQWNAAVEDCIAQNHQVKHQPSGQTLSYGQLAERASTLEVPSATSLTLKNKNDFNYIGKGLPSVDLEDIITGQAQYGIDFQHPDLVHASIERCPVLGGTVKSFETKNVLSISGVLDTVQIDGGTLPARFHALAGVAVIATNTWAAIQGRKQLAVRWNKTAHRYYYTDKYMPLLVAQTQARDPEKSKLIRHKGDATNVIEKSKNVFDATYTTPHMEHAPMEPPVATAFVQGEHCEVWASVQHPIRARDEIASALNIKKENVIVNVLLLGGGFGRKSKPDFAVEAAILSKKLGKPVKVTWTREDTVQHAYYHASSAQYYRAAVNSKGKINALEQHISSPSISSIFKKDAQYMAGFELSQGFGNLHFDIEHIAAYNYPAPAHVRIGWMRSVCNINHAFASNSFADEIAKKYGHDPIDYQLMLAGSDRIIDTKDQGFKDNHYGASQPQEHPLRTDRFKAVINAVKESSSWPAKTDSNEGWGFAAHPSFLSYVAVATKVRLESDNVIITDVHIAIDCGQVVNPDRVKSQMEGSVIFGMSAALYGEVEINKGEAVQSNFHDYRVCRMFESPNIVVTIIDSDNPPSGVGEPGVPPIAASITNAIAAAGGPRIRDLPIDRALKKISHQT